MIASLGNKQAAKIQWQMQGVPIIPGGKNPIYTVEEGMKEAETIGYPVIISCSWWRRQGMRKLLMHRRILKVSVPHRKKRRWLLAILRCTWSILYVIRHIEFRIIADKFGNVIHLGNVIVPFREIIREDDRESPCEVISDELRARMGGAAVKAAKQPEV